VVVFYNVSLKQTTTTRRPWKKLGVLRKGKVDGNIAGQSVKNGLL